MKADVRNYHSAPCKLYLKGLLRSRKGAQGKKKQEMGEGRGVKRMEGAPPLLIGNALSKILCWS